MIDPISVPKPASYADLIKFSRKIAERANLITSLRVVPVGIDGRARFNFSREQAALDLPIPTGSLEDYIDSLVEQKIAQYLAENLSIDAECNEDGTLTVTLSLD